MLKVGGSHTVHPPKSSPRRGINKYQRETFVGDKWVETDNSNEGLKKVLMEFLSEL